MSEIYFENSVGKTVRLDRDAIRIKDALSLREFEWSYTASEYPMQFGAKISKFTRGAAVKPICVVIRGKTRQECLSALNELLSVCEADILMQPRVLSCDNRTEKIIPHHPHLTG